MSNKKLQIVYLFGTGATQAEANIHDDTIRILATHIAEGMLNKIERNNIKCLNEVRNELSNPNADVEQLITLYESTKNSKHNRIVKWLKKIYKEEVEERLNKLGSFFSPKLLSALIDMHEINGFNEQINGILTLNYEDLLEKAIFDVKGSVNYLVEITNKHDKIKIDNISFPLLKLHGSFNWKNESAWEGYL